MRHDKGRGAWFVSRELMGDAAEVCEVGAGAKGTPGLVGTFELREHAEWAVRARNEWLARQEAEDG